jgi:hypothetical protein
MNSKNLHPIPWKTLLLPKQEKIVVAFGYEETGEKAPLSLYDSNHNIFRLDSQGKIIWQVRRDEKGKLKLEEWNERAARGEEEEWREPFMTLSIVYPDGHHNHDPTTGEPPDIAEWYQGCKVIVSSFSGQAYELDVDQGIIFNVTPHRQRPW